MPRRRKIAVRNVRRDGMDHLKTDEKKNEISEDEHKRLDTEVQKLTDETIAEIDDVLAAKDKEILQTVTVTSAGPKVEPAPVPTPRFPATSRSSWTATAAGRRRAACRAPPATAPAPRPRARCSAPPARRASNA